MSDRLEPIRPNEPSPRHGQSSAAEGRADRFRASLEAHAGGGSAGSSGPSAGREGEPDGADRKATSTDAVAWTAPRRALLLLLRDSVLAATARVLRLPAPGAVLPAPSLAYPSQAYPSQAYANSALLRLDVEPLPTVGEWLALVRSEQHVYAAPRRVGNDALGPWSLDRIERALGVAMRRGVEAAVRTFGEGIGVDEGGPIGLFDVLSTRLPNARLHPPSTTSS